VSNKEKTNHQNGSLGDINDMDLTPDRIARPSDPGGSEKTDKKGMAPELQAHIGRHLRAVFDEVAREPVPDRFLQLLKELEKNGPGK
jgi:hypothetical protein